MQFFPAFQYILSKKDTIPVLLQPQKRIALYVSLRNNCYTSPIPEFNSF